MKEISGNLTLKQNLQFLQKKSAIHSKRCWIENQLQEATIFFENGKITEIVKGSSSTFDSFNSNNIIDFGTALVMSGAMDVHVHVNEPGRTEWEGFDTATQAAAVGGITTIVDMPLNSSPVTTSATAFKQKLDATNGKLHVNCGFYGGLVPDNVGELEGLIEAGVLGIKAFLTHSGIPDFPNVGRKELEEAMPIIAKYQIPLLAHCELSDETVKTDWNKIAAGNYQAYLQSRPKRWENEAVKLMIELCEKYTCPVHIVHVSSAEALQEIAAAKAKGLPITAETCAHYLYFNAETIPNGNTLFKCAPPIRNRANNEQLKEALKSGILDFITSDHSPAPPSIKELESGNLQKAWGGISSLQYVFSAAWTSLKNTLTIEEFIPLFTSHPAKFLGMEDQKGTLQKGMDADFTIWSPEESFEVLQKDNRHRHSISPYIGERLFGKVKSTYVGGVEVFNYQTGLKKGFGKRILNK